MQMIQRWFMRGFILPAGLLLCSGMVAMPALAGSITYSFGGDVTAVDSLVSSRFNDSMTMSGLMTVDRVDHDASSSVGEYHIQSFTVTIGGYTVTLGPSSIATTLIFNTSPMVPLDGFGSVMEGMNGDNVNFLGPRIFAMALLGPGNLFGSDVLPTSVPSVASFTTFNQFRLAFGPEGVPGVVSGVVTSLTAVPLPAAVLLFGAGLISLVGLGAGGLRNLRISKV
jgi:hypothetical protein